MALLINVAVVMAVVTLVAVSADESCQGEDWKAKTIEQRASEAKWVAYVQAISDEMSVNGSATDFEVVVNVSCWLRKGAAGPVAGDGGDAPKTGDAPAAGDADHGDDNDGGNMTVPDAGQNITIILEKVNCKSHNLEKGMKYALFLEKYMDMFKIVNVNNEPGSLADPRPEDFEALYRGIDAAVSGKPDGECVDDVDISCFVGDPDKEVCMGAASLVATTATIVAAILASAIL